MRVQVLNKSTNDEWDILVAQSVSVSADVHRQNENRGEAAEKLGRTLDVEDGA